MVKVNTTRTKSNFTKIIASIIALRSHWKGPASQMAINLRVATSSIKVDNSW